MTTAPALKEIFNRSRIEHVADVLVSVYPNVDRDRFATLCAHDLDRLSLMQRLRQMTESLHTVLPDDYPAALAILEKMAPRINSKFVTLVLPDYVGQYGLHDFDLSMAYLKVFTSYGSSEYGIRPFLRADLLRALAIMQTWTRDDDEHARRLASEGCRPRLPWSFHLYALQADPEPVRAILDGLKQDPSLYVRKSVANHLNDITKTHPDWVIALLSEWPLDHPRSAWIARHALRTLIKQGHPDALALIGVRANPKIRIDHFSVSDNALRLGEKLVLNLTLTSLAAQAQKLEVDYVLHYVRRENKVASKVFKLKALTLSAGESVTLTRAQIIKDFSTRKHHSGRHDVELVVNGTRVARAYFDLSTE